MSLLLILVILILLFGVGGGSLYTGGWGAGPIGHGGSLIGIILVVVLVLVLLGRF
jgi:hypothetical protein